MSKTTDSGSNLDLEDLTLWAGLDVGYPKDETVLIAPTEEIASIWRKDYPGIRVILRKDYKGYAPNKLKALESENG